MPQKKKPRKRRVKPRTVEGAAIATMISAMDDGVVISTVAVAYTFAFRTSKIQASIVVLPDMPCSECQNEGIIFVSGLCIRCREEFHRALCLRSFAQINSNGVLALDAEALLCKKCSDTESDANQLPLPLGTAPDRMRARWN